MIALWSGYYGHPDLALEALWRIPVATDAWLLGFQIWRPIMSDMRKLPGLKDLVRDMGLADHWREFGWSDFCHAIGDE